jgi:hypothetical protein
MCCVIKITCAQVKASLKRYWSQGYPGPKLWTFAILAHFICFHLSKYPVSILHECLFALYNKCKFWAHHPPTFIRIHIDFLIVESMNKMFRQSSISPKCYLKSWLSLNICLNHPSRLFQIRAALVSASSHLTIPITLSPGPQSLAPFRCEYDCADSYCPRN